MIRRPGRPTGRPAPPRGLAAGYSISVAGLGLVLALLGPPPPGTVVLGPATVIAVSSARLPAGASGVRVLELDGWQVRGRWHFAVFLAFRRAGRTFGRSVLLPVPPVGAVLPLPVSAASYAAGWPAARLQPALARLDRAGCVAFQDGAAPERC